MKNAVGGMTLSRADFFFFFLFHKIVLHLALWALPGRLSNYLVICRYLSYSANIEDCLKLLNHYEEIAALFESTR